MAEKRDGRTEYNWTYRGDEVSDYRSKYTQGFDPNYVKRLTEEALQEEEEPRRRPEPERRRSSAGRRARLYAQQEIRTEEEESPEQEPEQEPVRARNGNRSRSRNKQKTAGNRGPKRSDRAYRRQVIRVRYTIGGIVAAAALFVLLLCLNTYTLSISVSGMDPLYLEKGETYTDPGATAVYRGSILHFWDKEVPVIADHDINTGLCGTYEVTYRAEYKDQEATAGRTVIVPDRTPPVITLDEDVNVVKKGEEWKDSFKAVDDQDGDITAKVEISGEVNMRRDGRYELTYRVQDAAGNEATASRWVTVSSVAINRPETARQGDKNVIYLTFDDGPGMYTDRVLEILDSHNVKATFFVTDANPASRELIAEEYSRGHTIGLHSMTHNYDIIYADGEAFWNDLDQEMAIIREQIGSDTPFMRFPGGSSNELITSNDELRRELAAGVKERGLVYYDWTVDSYDSNDANTADDIYWNLIDQLSVVSTKLVLCHDLKRTTVDALDEFLSWAIENHYVFLPITEESPVVHHVDL